MNDHTLTNDAMVDTDEREAFENSQSEEIREILSNLIFPEIS